MLCPHCSHKLTPEEVRSLWASYCGKLQTPHAGPGRPRTKPRCACGAMTLERAAKRGHVCASPSP
jgi:hypothetical protein